MPRTDLDHLAPTERQALLEFVHLLREQFDGQVQSTLLFGSKARGDAAPDSDLDVLVVVDGDDWRVHKQIRYLAADELGIKPEKATTAFCFESKPRKSNPTNPR